MVHRRRKTRRPGLRRRPRPPSIPSEPSQPNRQLRRNSTISNGQHVDLLRLVRNHSRGNPFPRPNNGIPNTSCPYWIRRLDENSNDNITRRVRRLTRRHSEIPETFSGNSRLEVATNTSHVCCSCIATQCEVKSNRNPTESNKLNKLLHMKTEDEDEDADENLAKTVASIANSNSALANHNVLKSSVTISMANSNSSSDLTKAKNSELLVKNYVLSDQVIPTVSDKSMLPISNPNSTLEDDKVIRSSTNQDCYSCSTLAAGDLTNINEMSNVVINLADHRAISENLGVNANNAIPNVPGSSVINENFGTNMYNADINVSLPSTVGANSDSNMNNPVLNLTEPSPITVNLGTNMYNADLNVSVPVLNVTEPSPITANLGANIATVSAYNQNMSQSTVMGTTNACPSFTITDSLHQIPSTSSSLQYDLGLTLVSQLLDSSYPVNQLHLLLPLINESFANDDIAYMEMPHSSVETVNEFVLRFGNEEENSYHTNSMTPTLLQEEHNIYENSSQEELQANLTDIEEHQDLDEEPYHTSGEVYENIEENVEELEDVPNQDVKQDVHSYEEQPSGSIFESNNDYSVKFVRNSKDNDEMDEEQIHETSFSSGEQFSDNELDPAFENSDSLMIARNSEDLESSLTNLENLEFEIDQELFTYRAIDENCEEEFEPDQEQTSYNSIEPEPESDNEDSEMMAQNSEDIGELEEAEIELSNTGDDELTNHELDTDFEPETEPNDELILEDEPESDQEQTSYNSIEPEPESDNEDSEMMAQNSEDIGELEEAEIELSNTEDNELSNQELDADFEPESEANDEPILDDEPESDNETEIEIPFEFEIMLSNTGDDELTNQDLDTGLEPETEADDEPIPDEEAGGDGHHNNGMLEFQITITTNSNQSMSEGSIANVEVADYDN